MTDTFITSVYQFFASYRAKLPLSICQCDVCMTLDKQQQLLSYPIKDIPKDYITCLMSSVPADDDKAYVQSIKPFIPKILELILLDNEIYVLPECTLDKLHLDNDELWNKDELAIFDEFMAVFIKKLCIQHFINYSVFTAILMFYKSGMRINKDKLIHLLSPFLQSYEVLAFFVECYMCFSNENMNDKNAILDKLTALFELKNDTYDDEFIIGIYEFMFDKKIQKQIHQGLENHLLNDLCTETDVITWQWCYDWLDK